ncbi:hypothetical protein HPB47_028343 [Ixodes persulcatus]|uniref:Uncharacterized protein n=1 Tax=Ixodes persulcatus TaxID=34615 RepID=A0AC60PUX5_IXOPE|nr:hypothetical protein HPB47_028343 [Ixodes persulcatus]
MNMLAAVSFILVGVVFAKCHGADIACSANEEIGDPCRNPDEPCPITRANSDATSNDSCGGCVCKEGFLRTVLGECVTPEQCDRCKDKEFEVFMSCGTACPLVCNQTYPKVCRLQCVTSCFCLPGYIRPSKDGPCVPIEECPPTCEDDVTMIYTTCRSACPPTCNEKPVGCPKDVSSLTAA